MKLSKSFIQDDLICVGKGYKPSNMHQWGPGVRDIYALHYILSGKGYYVVNNVTHSLKAGESFLIIPNTEVFYYPEEKDPWEYIWVEFKGNEAIRLISMTNFSIRSPVAPRFMSNLESLYYISEGSGVRDFEKERSSAKLRLLLSYYMEYFPKLDSIIRADYVKSAKEFISNNYWKASLKVSDIVDYVKIERSYLFKLFKEETGMSVLNYLTAYRIQRACVLLSSKELSIKSVACSVGYEDQLYFSKVFKKITSYTPTEYMKEKDRLGSENQEERFSNKY